MGDPRVVIVQMNTREEIVKGLNSFLALHVFLLFNLKSNAFSLYILMVY